MTTIPTRIDEIRPVIEAVLAQSVPIERLELNIPYKCIRTNEPYTIPMWLDGMDRVMIFRTEDYGSITKVAPTFLRYQNDRDTYIWSVDDDCAYPNNQLELLCRAHRADKRRILTRYGGKLNSDGTVGLWFGEGEVTMFEGFGSVLYPPACIGEDFLEYLISTSANNDCRMSDDLVLSMYFSARRMPIYLYNIPAEAPYMVTGFLPHASKGALSEGGHVEKYKRVFSFVNSLSKQGQTPLSKLELGCGMVPTAGYVHHDRRKHSAHVDVVHDLNELPWPWEDESCEEILGLDVFEHLHLMPEQWLHECYRILVSGGVLRLRVPVFGSPWHLIDPTHVRGFHPLNFDYFIRGRTYWQQYGCFYFEFAYQEGTTEIEEHNIVVTLKK